VLFTQIAGKARKSRTAGLSSGALREHGEQAFCSLQRVKENLPAGPRRHQMFNNNA
jgi:hypothetical protein